MIKPINKFLFILFAGLSIGYIVYIRLILVRLPKELICTEENFPFYLFSFFILLYVFALRIYYYIFAESVADVSTNSWTKRIKDKLQLDFYSDYYTAQLKKLHEFLITHIPYNGNFLEFLVKLVTKKYFILYIMYFGLTYGPRYFLGLVFFTESIFLQKLNLFYSCIPILFVPLLCQYILFALHNFVKTNIEGLSKHLEVELILSKTEKYNVTASEYNDYLLALDEGEDFKAFIYFNANYQAWLKKQNIDILEETTLIVNFFYLLLLFNKHWAVLNELKLKYNIYLQLGSLIIYIISWIYIILYTGTGSTEVLKLIHQMLALACKEEPFSGIFLD